jgi:6-phosphogluconolactonase
MKPPADVRSFPSAEALTQAAASDFGNFLGRRSGGGEVTLVALSGGRIAKDFFRTVASMVGGSPVLLRHVHFFWADERCVPPGDRESNFRLADEWLFQPARVVPENIHRIRGELPPAAAASAAVREFREVCAHVQHAPRFDLVLLGMGEDGHVASLFPAESRAAQEDPALFRAVVAAKPPPHRVTVGYGVLRDANAVWVLASGAGKEPALQQSLKSPDATPLGRVFHHRPATRIYTEVLIPGGYRA